MSPNVAYVTVIVLAILLWIVVDRWFIARDDKMTDEQLLVFFTGHHPHEGVMASPTHWAYRGDWRKPEWPRDEDETPGRWFADCDCGWDSKPNTFETKEEAHDASVQHLIDAFKEQL